MEIGAGSTGPFYPMSERTYVLDTEIFKNYFLVGFKNIRTGKVISYEMTEGDRLDIKRCRRLLEARRTIGFNSNGFDIPLIYAAFAGYGTKALKKIADEIIQGGAKPWDIEREYDFRIPRNLNHIDLIEVAPGQASLKLYSGRLHAPRMQDLPYHPDDVLTDEQIEEVYRYWVNDLDNTIILFDALADQISLREEMSKEYGEDLRSKSDAQVAEAVIRKQVTDLIGAPPKRPTIRGGTGYHYNIPDYLKFKSPELRKVLRIVEGTVFRVSEHGNIIMPKSLQDLAIPIGSGVYRMGIGGLHSSEKVAAHESDEDTILVDRDVTSYYPYIIINQKLHPKQMGWAFQKVYKRIVSRRVNAKIAAKEAGDAGDKLKATKFSVEADSLKITVNGSFGKFGSKWSSLYSPDLLIQVTITGQLSLLLLIERLEDAGIPVVSANTDGIVIKCPVKRQRDMEDIVSRWERDTSFETEESQYKALYSRDVNNYIAVKTDGSVKTKGAFAVAPPGKPPLLNKNPTNEICVEAVIAHITKGASIYRTIRDCRDIRKFVTVRTVRGGATKGNMYLGKAIRWYYSTETTTAIHYSTRNKSGNFNKVPRTEGAMPIMDLPKEFPDDVDYGWYIREARDILKDIGFEADLVGDGKRRRKKVDE